MSEVGEKHLRGKLKQYQAWLESAVDHGLIDLENTPEPFDRKMYLLNKEAKDTRTIGSNCHWCNRSFKENEAKTTSNHIMFFHVEPCAEQYNRMENKSEKFENNNNG